MCFWCARALQLVDRNYQLGVIFENKAKNIRITRIYEYQHIRVRREVIFLKQSEFHERRLSARRFFHAVVSRSMRVNTLASSSLIFLILSIRERGTVSRKRGPRRTKEITRTRQRGISSGRRKVGSSVDTDLYASRAVHAACTWDKGTRWGRRTTREERTILAGH